MITTRAVSYPALGQSGSSNTTNYRNPRSDNEVTRMGDDPPTGTVLVNSHRGQEPVVTAAHPIHSVGRSGGKPHDKLVGNGADTSDDDFIPATATAQEATISHSRPCTMLVCNRYTIR
jgi:hypothetical protein